MSILTRRESDCAIIFAATTSRRNTGHGRGNFSDRPSDTYLVAGIVVSLSAKERVTELYRAVHMWLDANVGSRVEVTLGLRGYDVTDMTEELFLATWQDASRTQ
jgi:hypothetical protein